MRGYPKRQLCKKDFENLLTMPEFEKNAKDDLERLLATDDAKISISEGTEENPTIKEIVNPMPSWKRAGFRSKIDVADSVKAVTEVCDAKIDDVKETILEI